MFSLRKLLERFEDLEQTKIDVENLLEQEMEASSSLREALAEYKQKEENTQKVKTQTYLENVLFFCFYIY